MTKHLKKLVNYFNKIKKTAGRYDKVDIPLPPQHQPAYKYVMYLKLMRNLDDASFHHLKRKYLNTGVEVQIDCEKELDKIISEDAIKRKTNSFSIRKEFNEKLNKSPKFY